jgi:uncharacterized membrane protein
MAPLDNWLKQATRNLSAASAAQVRQEIREHYESACGDAISEGAALAALGDPRVANRQYRRVLLTRAEARLLRNGQREARAICGRPWLKRILPVLPGVALLASAVMFFAGSLSFARILLAAAIMFGLFCLAPFLPLYTASRSRAFRIVKWIALPAALLLAYGADSFRWSWLLAASLWPFVWIEWTRISIRRKLRITDWPRHLYL